MTEKADKAPGQQVRGADPFIDPWSALFDLAIQTAEDGLVHLRDAKSASSPQAASVLLKLAQVELRQAAVSTTQLGKSAAKNFKPPTGAA